MSIAVARPEFAGRLFRRRAGAPAPDGPPPSGLKKVFGNFAHLAGGKACAGVVSAIYLLIITRDLGAHGYGLLILMNAYAVLMGTIFAYCCFQGLVRYGAIALEAGDRPGFARIARYMTVIELSMGVIAIIAAALLAPVIGPKLGWPSDIVPFGVIYSLAIIAQIRATPQGVLQAAGRFDILGAYQVILPGGRLIGALVVWLCGFGLMGYLVVWLAASIFEGLILWVMALGSWRKLVPDEPLLGPWRGVLDKYEGFGRFTIMAKIESMLRELGPKLAPLTVGWVLGPAAAGAFALALRGTNLLEKPAGLLSRAIYPVLAGQNARKEGAPLWHTVWRSTLIVSLAASPIVILLAFFGPHVLPLLGGKTFQAGGALLLLVALSRLGSLATAPLAAGLVALGKPAKSMGVAMGANLLLYPLMPPLLKWQGVEGAGWHALIQTLFAAVALAIFFMRDARVRADTEKADPKARPLEEAVVA